MTPARAPYMEWAKNRPTPAIDLAGSNVLACSLEDLPGAREAIELSGDNSNGYLPLLEAIAARAGVAPDRIATAGGCAGANFLVCAALLASGDDVLVEWPGYDPLAAAARMLGASVRFFERRVEEKWALDPERVAAALTPRTTLVIVSSPHNPSGVAVSGAALDALGRLAERRGFHVLVDEVYVETMEGEPPQPAATRSPALVSTNSLTKSYGLSALRCGWSVAAPGLTESIRRARDVVDGSGPIPAERLAALAFSHRDRLAARTGALLLANRGLWRDFLARAPELECVASDASIVFPRFSDGRDAAAFAARLFDLESVAVAPGAFFGAPAHFRVALGGDTEKLRAGLEAIARCLRGR